MRKHKKAAIEKGNLENADGGQRDMNFKVSVADHTWFKAEAVARGLSMKDFLLECFKFYLNANGSEVHPKSLRFE
jgi:hypothetical protein